MKEFRYVQQGQGRLKVALNPGHYGKSLKTILELAKELSLAVPFPFEIVDETKIHILGGARRKGVVSVEMEISYEIPDSDAISKLQAKGFYEGMELILG